MGNIDINFFIKAVNSLTIEFEITQRGVAIALEVRTSLNN